MASIFGSLVGPHVDIIFSLNNDDERRKIPVQISKDRKELCPLYTELEAVTGKVTVRVKDGKKLEHSGIKIEFIGEIDLAYERGSRTSFISLSQELAAAGEIKQIARYEFDFKAVEKPYEAFWGSHVKCRYFLRVTVGKRLSDIVREKMIWVYSYKDPTDLNNVIKMEVGIEDCLHIEFEYNKSKYHLKDVVVGKIYFILVRLKIRTMELSIIKRETTGVAPNQYNDNETIAKYEIMDGAPGKGECIPIRLFLSGLDLTPTFRDVCKKYSVRYYLNLVLIDEENRRYFKQQEITIYRGKPDGGMHGSASSVNVNQQAKDSQAVPASIPSVEAQTEIENRTKEQKN